MSELNNVVVFCGSKSNVDSVYLNGAEGLGKALLHENIGLVYGSGKTGLMGRLAETVHNGGGKVFGVGCKQTGEGAGYGECILIDTMHERKRIMYEKSDGFIALPGGLGTMDELLESMAWCQLKIHSKPIGILNVNNFYDKFLEWVQHAVEKKFVYNELDMLVVHNEPMELLKLMKEKTQS